MRLGVLGVGRTGLGLGRVEGFLAWLGFRLLGVPGLRLVGECLKGGRSWSCRDRGRGGLRVLTLGCPFIAYHCVGMIGVFWGV